MTYSVLTVGLPDKLIKALQALIFQYDLSFTSSATTREASRLLEQQVFHLLIIGLDYLKNIHQADWLTDIRRVSFVPLIVLSSTPDQDVNIPGVSNFACHLAGERISQSMLPVPLLNKVSRRVEHRLIAGAQVNRFVHITLKIVQSSTSIIHSLLVLGQASLRRTH